MTTNHLAVPAQGWNVGAGGDSAGRSPLDLLSRLGMGLLSLFAKLAESASNPVSGIKDKLHRKLKNEGPREPIPDCCSLALPDKECPYRGTKSNYICSEGYHRRWWFCCEGTRQAACAECTTYADGCWQGEFECSIWWWTGQSC